MQNTVGASNGQMHRYSIEEFFAEKVILITGASGFLGKSLVYKLLRACPRLITIFILLRPKKGQTIKERFQKLLAHSIFDRLRNEAPEQLNKIRYVEGDIGSPKLGLSIQDRNMIIQTVNIVFHSAATVRFNEPLKVAINLNTKATSRIIDLCRDIINLISFVYVSTAYSNANRFEINETIYNTKLKPSTVIEICDNVDDETLMRLQPLILEGHPNTYTFTKNLAEQLILTKASDLPVAIVRPSIICPAISDPCPGWTDNIFGISGAVVAVIKGVLRYYRYNPKMTINLVPIDYVSDTVICASWRTIMQRSDSIKIYNCTCSQDNLSYRLFMKLILKACKELPSKHTMWYPNVSGSTNKYICILLKYILHYFPAYMADIYLTLLGKKATMMKLVKQLFIYLDSIEYFRTHEWKFHRNNMNNLTEDLKALKDCSNFKTDTRDLDWNRYICDYVVGIRKFILKENVTENTHQRRLFILHCIYRITQISSIVALLAIIIKGIGYWSQHSIIGFSLAN